MTDDSVLKEQVDLDIRPDGPARAFLEKRLDLFHLPAEVAHHVEGMGMKGAHVEMLARFLLVVDPHPHVDEVQLADPAAGQPFLRAAGRRGEAVVQVDPVADALLLRQGDHFTGLVEPVRDGFFAQNRDPGAQQLHGRRIMMTAVLLAGRADADRVDLETGLEHRLDRGETGHLKLGGGRVGFFLNHVADGDKTGIGVFLVAPGVVVADATQTDDRYIDHGGDLRLGI